MMTRGEGIGLTLGGAVCLSVLLLMAVYAPEKPPVRAVVHDSRPPWERIPQAAVPEVEAFATTFLHQLGYTLGGTVNCARWTTDWDNHKQYTCYGVYAPTRPPVVLTCGPVSREAIEPLGCTIHLERSVP
jgi:hypothetical protein